MKRMLYYVRLWGAYLRVGFVMLVQYPADTVIWIVSMLLREASAMIGIVTIASVAGGLGSWSLYEICLLFSICAIIEGLGQAFFDCIWSIDSIIRRGKMDVLLVRPASPFVQLLGEYIHFQAVISIFVYVGIMIYSMYQLRIGVSAGRALFIVETIVCGTIINSGIYAVFNCLNFWIINGEDIAVLVQTCREFAKYPLSVFPVMVKTFFSYIIPFGFVGFYPAAYLTGKAGAWVAAALPLCAVLIAGIAGMIWRRGLNSYNSTGT